MSFFDSTPASAPGPPRWLPSQVWARPDAAIPGSVPADLILVRREGIAIAVGSVRAYPNGFEFTVQVWLRREDEAGGVADALLGWPGPGSREPADGLRLGVMYADGRRAAIPGEPFPPVDDPRRLVFWPGGGGGNQLSCQRDFWVHPLPPPGLVTLVASWPRQGIIEARAELDGAAITDAAQRAVVLWPDQPGTF